ncbi:MAG TPA: DUF1257 domain-containing protein [Bryobacteraceae bacterium]|nr:DUF1257 domain-containing protein [Bryobacteraceae bacterium]
MSAYGEYTTHLCEEKYLIEGLAAMGYRVEVHPNGAPLIGYHGDERPERAHVIIRRAQLDSASNDIGFVRGTDGRFRAILSEYDRSIGYDDRWLGKVHQNYKEKQTLAVAKAKGYIFRGKEIVQTANGPQIRLQFVAR